ncbi:MAG: fumarylacetoacetate hydrolase family protein [Amphiplicatus sp.]
MASAFVFEPPARAVVSVAGGGVFPVRRIFCVGKNYPDHVREMGDDPKSSPPVFFAKPADAVVASGAVIPYPPATKNLHYEGELVVALGGGARIFGYAAGCDLTRRDLQAAAKNAGGPWDSAKAFDRSAPIGEIARGAALDPATRLSLAVNGKTHQDAALSEMIWSTPEIIEALSAQFELAAGDLIFTGTPSGVGPLTRGDKVEVRIGALPALSFSIA